MKVVRVVRVVYVVVVSMEVDVLRSSECCLSVVPGYLCTVELGHRFGIRSRSDGTIGTRIKRVWEKV